MRFWSGVALGVLALLPAAPAPAAIDPDHAVVGLVSVGQGQHLKGARVTARAADGRRIGGITRTNRHGAFLLEARALRKASARQRVWVSARGGRVGGKPFRGALRVVVEDYRPPAVLHLNYATAAVAYHYARRSRGGLGAAEKRVRQTIGIPDEANLGSNIRHGTWVMHAPRVHRHQARLGGLRQWLAHVHRRARAGKKTRHYRQKGTGRARAAQAFAAANAALGAAKDDCNNSTAAGQGQQAAGWGMSVAASEAGVALLGAPTGQAESFLTSKSNTCAVLKLLGQIIQQLAAIQGQLNTIQSQLTEVLDRLEQADRDTWQQYYSGQVALLADLLGPDGSLTKAYDDYEAYIALPKGQRTIGVANRYLNNDFWPVVNGFSRLFNVLIPPQGTLATGVFEAAWINALKTDPFITSRVGSDFETVNAHWQSVLTHAATIVAEYHHARGGLSPADYVEYVGGNPNAATPMGEDEVGAAIQRVVDLAETYPKFDKVPAWESYDPSPTYKEWNGSTFATVDRGLIWSGVCPRPYADPHSTERTDVGIFSGRCTAGRFMKYVQDQSHGGYSCAANLPIVREARAGDWLPATKEQWDVLMARHDAGTTLSGWLQKSTAFGARMDPNLPIAYFMLAGDASGGNAGNCAYGRYGIRSAAEAYHWYTWGTVMTTSLYHLAAAKQEDWLCQSGQEVDRNNYLCPLRGPNDMALFMVVRPPLAGEDYIPTITDKATGNVLYRFSGDPNKVLPVRP